MESDQYPQGELLITGWCKAVQSPGSPASSSSILLVIKRLLACKGQDLKEHLQIISDLIEHDPILLFLELLEQCI